MSDEAALDGFTNPEARSAAHQPIVDRVNALVSAETGVVVDLGCGSGALLERLTLCRPGLRPLGVEVDPARARVARERLDPLGGQVVVVDLLDRQAWSSKAWGEGHALVALLMPGRLVEANITQPDAVAELVTALHANVKHTVVYAYGDWLSRYGDLDGLATAAGLSLEPPSLDESTTYPRWRSCALLTQP